MQGPEKLMTAAQALLDELANIVLQLLSRAATSYIMCHLIALRRNVAFHILVQLIDQIGVQGTTFSASHTTGCYECFQ